MTGLHLLPPNQRTMAGLTLIELLVAMVLGILVSAGIITVFVHTSAANKMQVQMARVQETGRYAVQRINQDLRMVNAQYCSSTGGVADAQSASALYLDGLRAPVMLATAGEVAFADLTTDFGTGGYPAWPTNTFPLPSFLFMRGYNCSTTGCSSIDPSDEIADIPSMGTAPGDRVVGADVLTVRYIDGSAGWSLGTNDSMVDSDGTLTEITITPESGEPAVAAFDVAMLADCNSAQVFAVDFAGSTIKPAAGAGNLSIPEVPGELRTMAAPKLFNFEKALTTVTYYLRVVSADNSADGFTTGALMRRVDGGTARELVRGIERLDFRYAVETDSGDTVYLTAQQMDDGVSGVTCPAQPDAITTKGCLWRAVKSIEVSMLVDGQRRLGTLSDGVLAYAYPPDGLTPKPPGDASHAVDPVSDQGFVRGMLRRPFSAVVSVRNYNP